jgi:transcriptional regulator
VYIPKHFQIQDEEQILQFIENHSFATLFSQHEGEPYATHLPIDLDRENKKLYGHFAKANPQWTDIEGQQVLVIFQGPHSYISPSWYETSKAVPTWNYVSVHVYGSLEMIKGEREVMKLLQKQVSKYEKPNSTYQLAEVDSKYVEGLRNGIVAFNINISRIEGKEKLSQNHPVQRQQLVIEQLEQTPHENNHKIAKLMREKLVEE